MVLTALTISLGFWQLDRADAKIVLGRQLQAAMQAAPTPFAGALNPYQHVRVTGTYSGRHWLIDNQTFERDLGYQVLSEFVSSDGMALIVNRGFVARTGFDGSLPTLITPTQTTVLGHGYLPASPWRTLDYQQLLTGGQKPSLAPSILVLPVLDWPQLLTLAFGFQQAHAALMLRLDEAESDAYPRRWQIGGASPDKHRSYAAQWFLMAVTLNILLTVFILKRKKVVAA